MLNDREHQSDAFLGSCTAKLKFNIRLPVNPFKNNDELDSAKRYEKNMANDKQFIRKT